MLAVASASFLAVPRPSLASSPLFGRLLDICFAITVATARQARAVATAIAVATAGQSWQARAVITAVAVATAGELTCQHLLAIASADLP